MLSAFLRGGDLAWTIARAGVDQALMSAFAAVVELIGPHGGADSDVAAFRPHPFIDDADVKLRVASALRADEALGSSTIVVESVYDGLVVLAGRVPALAMHRRAFEVAANIPGVRRVMSTIDVAPSTAADGSTNAGVPLGRAATLVVDERSGAIDARRGAAADAATSDPCEPTTAAISERGADVDASAALPLRTRRRRRHSVARGHDRCAGAPMRADAAPPPDEVRSESSNGACSA